jgi:hypothetical protein
MSKFKDLMMKVAEQIEDKMNQIKQLQTNLSEMQQDMTKEELESLQDDPEVQAVVKKLNSLMEELYG